MNKKHEFYHALRINPERCVGCTHCVMKCPTGALRIRDGKAFIHKNWCVDCGECLKSCPVHAIYVEQDDFNRIFDYACRVALVPAIFFGQFSRNKSEEEIVEAIYSLGFTHVVPVEITVDQICAAMKSDIERLDERPAISSFCPAIVRLIQIRFPDLVENILPVKTPVDATATVLRKQLLDDGYTEQEIGMFYVAPCAAKIAAVKGDDEYRDVLTGVLNMDFLYNKVYQILQSEQTITPDPDRRILPLTRRQMCWSQTAGEADNFDGRTLAIDEIHNVIEFIERMELTGDIRSVDFLELRACDRSCVGGVLAPANRFIAAERVNTRARNHHDGKSRLPDVASQPNIDFLCNNIHTPSPQVMTKLVYEGDISQVIKKMNLTQNIMCFLPGIDCGACGSPGCQSLSEDIIRGEANLSDCVFLQRQMLKLKTMSAERACAIVEKVWGKDRLDKNCHKKGAKYEGK